MATQLEKDAGFMDKYSRQIGAFGLETMAKVRLDYEQIFRVCYVLWVGTCVVRSLSLCSHHSAIMINSL